MFGLRYAGVGADDREIEMAYVLEHLRAAALADGFVLAGEGVDESGWSPVPWFRLRAPGVGTGVDDIPCWELRFESGAMSVRAVHEGAGQTTGGGCYAWLPLSESSECVMAGDARAGWLWFAFAEMGAVGVLCATSSRRVPADMTEGLSPRCGLALLGVFYPVPHFRVPWALAAASGAPITNAWLQLWSPLGRLPAVRHPDSPLPRAAAPILPAAGQFNYGGDTTVAIYGELEGVMVATNGYAWGEEVAPGWRAYGRDDLGWFALRAPAAIADIPPYEPGP